jgi:hypothetical protein
VVVGQFPVAKTEHAPAYQLRVFRPLAKHRRSLARTVVNDGGVPVSFRMIFLVLFD